MSKTDQFWQYAKEAILAASDAKADENKQGCGATIKVRIQRQSG
jgi:hypothetical protein